MNRPRASGQELEAKALRVLQLTDTHLYADPEGRLLGQNTRRTLDLVLSAAFDSLGHIDFILLTGDLVHDESAEGYSYLQQRLTALNTPCYCLPGNHDHVPTMARVLNGRGVHRNASVRRGAWHLVLLDSTIPGEEGGHLSAEQLVTLEDSLAARPQDPTLVCLHHPPVLLGSAWIDTMALRNTGDFFEIIDRNPQVRGVLWGHAHQQFSSKRNDVSLLGSPSTCIQFLPGSREFALDTLTPGFRWLELRPDGGIDTGVERIAAYPDPLDPTNAGY